jgi:hypothetical protein
MILLFEYVPSTTCDCVRVIIMKAKRLRDARVLREGYGYEATPGL